MRFAMVNRSVSVGVGLWQRSKPLYLARANLCNGVFLLKSVPSFDIILKESGKQVKSMPSRIQYVSLLQALFKYWFGNLVEIRKNWPM